jgi:hypothetical protein
MLSEGDGKFTPTDIWEWANKFGEQDYVYPLLLISKPYFAWDLSLMIKSE